MELEDRINIATPEGIELQMVLAGAGSRFIACVIDISLELILIALAAVAAIGLLGGGLGAALFAIAVFVILYLYNVLFEVLAGGRTPGKRTTRLRVVRDGGSPVDLPASAIRNLLRLIDWLPFAYLVGLTSILVTERNQRLGDIAGGTLVIRDLAPQRPPALELGAGELGGWDVSAVNGEELAAVRRFLERRESLDRGARVELAHRLQQGLRAKVAGAPEGLDAESFLEQLARVKASR